MTHKAFHQLLGGAAVGALLTVAAAQVEPAQAQQQKPNILVVMGDDVGWFNIGAYHPDGSALTFISTDPGSLAAGLNPRVGSSRRAE